jgi:hypothetical protein
VTEAIVSGESVDPPLDIQNAPDRPRPISLPGGDERRAKLVRNVRDALNAIPLYFQSATFIEGLEAGDLFSLNGVLGGTIEIQTVATLNKIRDVWDPDNEWTEYGFIRSNQSFPDVRLVSRSEGLPSSVLGIELKGWYLLSKEGEPSFRYTATRNAASPYDLLVVVPWRLSNVLAGVPVVYEPFISQAQHAADLRNYYWRHLRGEGADGRIIEPPGVTEYAPPKSKVSDKPVSDGGGNFGRVARVPGLMKDYCEQMLTTPVSGIEAHHWVKFFKTYSDNADADKVDAAIARALKSVDKANDDSRTAELTVVLRRLAELVAGDPSR